MAVAYGQGLNFITSTAEATYLWFQMLFKFWFTNFYVCHFFPQFLKNCNEIDSSCHSSCLGIMFIP